MVDPVILISEPSVSVSQATSSQLYLDSRQSMEKLDRANPVSFQNIQLTFTKDTPSSGTGIDNTLIYSFAHNYNYTPRFWSLFNFVLGGTSLNNYGNPQGTIIATSPIDNSEAFLVVDVDASNFYIYLLKNYSGASADVSVSGLFINLRVYIFVDGV